MSKNKLEYKFFYRRNLPHYQPKGYLFFITYRLAFTLPKNILNKLSEEKKEFDQKLKNMDIKTKSREKINFNNILFDITDDFLGKYQDGPHWLRNNKIAQIVIDSLFYNHKKKYELLCYTIMTNHVHIIIKPLVKKDIPFSLSQIMQSHKSFTAHKANKILQRAGQFWLHENYDHFIRDRDDLNRIIGYILRNPVKAGLINDYKEWKYSWLNEDDL